MVWYRHLWRHAVLAAAAGLLAACSASCGPPPELPGGAAADGTGGAPGGAPGGEPTDRGYRLGSGDEIRLTVFGQEDLSGTFQVDGLGNVSLPLIGQVAIGGLSVDRAEAAVAEALARGYLNEPQVSMEVLSYRPFYVLGEVEQAGSYPYVNGMTVLNAVALAGGYTYRADDDAICLSRGGETFQAEATTGLQPGDVLHVEERLF